MTEAPSHQTTENSVFNKRGGLSVVKKSKTFLKGTQTLYLVSPLCGLPSSVTENSCWQVVDIKMGKEAFDILWPTLNLLEIEAIEDRWQIYKYVFMFIKYLF